MRPSVWILAAAGFLLPLASVGQPASIPQAAAMQRAVAILRGDPYGKTDAQVRQHIVGSALVFPGSRTGGACGPVRKPVWVFDVAVPARVGGEAINGSLVLDAITGKMECATLPFLD